MKSLKVALFGLLIATVGMLAATKANAQTTIKIFEYTDPAGFVIGSTSNSELIDLSNWTLRAAFPSCPSAEVKFCAFQATYTGTSHPTNQQLLDALRLEYIARGNDFDDNDTFQRVIVVSGVNVTVTYNIQLKP